MLIDLLYLIGGFVLLILGGNLLLRSSVDMASRLGIPKVVIGLTIVSFATSAPELIVSVNAALSGSSGLALGNVIGSNIANLGLVLAVTVLISPIAVPKNFFRMDWIYLMASTILIILFILFDSMISRFESVGITAIISPIPVEDPRFLHSDIWWMLGFAAVLLPLAFLGKKYTFQRIGGIILIMAYITFIFPAF